MRINNIFKVLPKMPDEFFRLIPSDGVYHLAVTENPDHNAVWDMAVSPEGNVFFSVCGESFDPLYARLYEFNPRTNELKHHLNLEDEIFFEDEALHTSKFHTALSFIGNGEILAATHTTSPSTLHPRWMPYEYVDHIWEGFAGSHLVRYNYNTGDFRDLGVFTPRDTCYGGTFEPVSGDYVAITWMTGEGYVYNIHTGKRRALGQVSDTQTSRLYPDGKGHLYGSTYSGELFYYDGSLGNFVYTGLEVDGLMRHAVICDNTDKGGDKIIYLTTGPCGIAGRGQMLYAWNVTKGTVSKIGRPVPKAESPIDPKTYMNAYGMAMDSKGRLWYGCMVHADSARYFGAKLYVWDFQNGKEPVDCGYIGSDYRTVTIPSEIRIVDDYLVISDSNHTQPENNPTGVVSIDINKFYEAAVVEGKRGGYSTDIVTYLPFPEENLELFPGDLEAAYKNFENWYHNVWRADIKFGDDNNFRTPLNDLHGISFYKQVGQPNGKVHAIAVDNDGKVTFTCGEKENAFTLTAEKQDGKYAITKKEKAEGCKAAALPEISAKLPYHPGRQYIAKASAVAELENGKKLVGTQDGMLALVDGENVYSFGAVCACGKVHTLCAVPGSDVVYGLAGYHRGIGNVFTWNPRTGVQQLGILPAAACDNGGFLSIYRPTVMAVSPNGQYIAIGSDNEMGGIAVAKAN